MSTLGLFCARAAIGSLPTLFFSLFFSFYFTMARLGQEHVVLELCEIIKVTQSRRIHNILITVMIDT